MILKTKLLIEKQHLNVHYI